jgi:hypothetical protein
MSLLEKLRPRTKPVAGIETETVGHALVVHAPEGMSPAARSLASALPADPDHELVVADVPAESTSTFWEAVAASVPRGKRGLRLVLSSRSRELGAGAGQWLSTKLGRAVLAPVGVQFRDLNGCVFVEAGPGTGWVRFRPGREPEREGKRFPRPPWESAMVNEPFRVGTSTVEPVPSGLWLRPDGDKGRLDAGRNRLTHSVPCQPDILTIALGGRDLPPLPLGDVVPLWHTLPAADRPKVRFVHFGPIDLPTGVPFGPALANLLDDEVTCYTGMPVGAMDVYLLRPDGSHGWNAFVQQLTFSPGGAVSPRPRAYRTPLAGLAETAPGTYEYAPDVVIEVVLAGLWIRPPEAPAHAGAIRGMPVDPATNLLLYEDSDPRSAGRMLTVAQEVLGKLDYSMRLASKPLPTTEVYSLPDPSEVLLPWLTELLDTRSLPHPSKAVAPDELRVAAPKPQVDVTAKQPAERMEASRALVRQKWPDEFGDAADPVRQALADHPKIAADRAGEDALVDAVALRLYLSGRMPELDAGLRSGSPGPHVHIGRCVMAALTGLPSHRGGTFATLTPTPAQWEFYRSHKVLTELGFHTMLAEPSSLEGSVDLLIWSITARRTAWLDAEAGRVVFAPGACFKVLELTEGEEGKRGRILLRELSSTEIGPDGKVDENRRSLDQLATTSLRRFLEKPMTVPKSGATPVDVQFRLPGVGDD